VKKPKEDVPLQYFERSYILLAVCIAATVALCYWVYTLIQEVSPWSFIAAIPAVIMVFQTLWLILNPYAVIYEDKFEMKRSVIDNKIWYGIDRIIVRVNAGCGV
jgi:hypothetical protein